MAVPIAEDAVDNSDQVELGAESVNHHLANNARGGQGSLDNLEGIGALRRLHRGVDDGRELDGHLVGLNGIKRPGDEHLVCLWSGGAKHGNR